MEDVSSPPSLFDAPQVPGRFVNPRCIVHEGLGLYVAMVDGAPFHTWPVGDVVAENLFVVQARQAQIATIEELSIGLGRTLRTLYRVFQQYSRGGVEAVIPRKRGPVPEANVDILRDAAIRRLHAGGDWNHVIAKVLACSPVTVVRALQRMGLAPNRARQQQLVVTTAGSPSPLDEPTPPVATTEGAVAPTTDGPVAPAPLTVELASPTVVPPSEHRALPATLDRDPLDRSMDRFLASQGALQDASPLFAPGGNLPYLGVLLAIPGLVQSGLLEEAHRLYTDLKSAFYGVRTSLVAIVLFSLLRLNRPEHLKEFSPAELGRVLGLDRAPEVKTLRRMIHRLADGPGEALLLSVAQRRARASEQALAWLYIDGHVRVYNGKERLPMAHVTRMRISAPATQDMWVHDGDGRPLLFVTHEAHPSLAQALVPVLEDARRIVGEHRVTIVFDRGGWSPALFAKLDALGADVLTYRKGAWDAIPGEWFSAEPGRPGEPDWLLHDASVRLPNGMWMRQITRLTGDHQTAIVTTRQDLPARVLAARMFDRWKQENFFKYMREEFDLDGLIEYGAEPANGDREVPNPTWTRRDKALRKARLFLQARLAHRVDRSHAEVVAAQAVVDELRQQRNAVPRRLPVAELEQPTVKLLAHAKHLYDGLKMLAWQIETDLFRAITPHYRRAEDEGRTLITSAFRSAGRLDVTPHELVITLAPQSSPHRTQAVAELCRLLDQTETCFPGTNLRIRYRIAGSTDPLSALPTAT